MNTVPSIFGQAAASHQRGDYDSALEGYGRILALDPWHPETLHNTGLVHQARGNAAQAELYFYRALHARPAYGAAHRSLGVLLSAQGRHREAERIYRAGLELIPADRSLHDALGRCLVDMGRLEDALQTYEAALKLIPNDNGLVGAVGAVAAMLSRWDAALPMLRQAVEVEPHRAESWSNLGTCLKMLSDFDGALAAFQRACDIQPDLASAQWNLSLSLLLLGQSRQGWDRYHWRWQVPNFPSPIRKFAVPQWQGEDLTGKRLLVHWEQGFGDTIQFAALIPALKARGAIVIVECQRPLYDLFATLDGVDHLVRAGETLPPFDCYISLLDIPRLLRLDLLHPHQTGAAATPYLRAPADRAAQWAEKLGPRVRKRIGLVWSGSATHLNDRIRSLRLEQLTWLLESDQWDCIAVQVGARDEDRAFLGRFPNVRLLGDDVRDFADTAAILSQVDLLITVDTSPAHLAGALGVPVWVMIAAVPDWRWQLNRDDCPWYPSLRLFRQASAGEWPAVVEAVRHAVESQGAGFPA